MAIVKNYSFESNGIYNFIDQSVVCIQNAYIATNGLVLDSNFKPIDECFQYCSSINTKLYDRIVDTADAVKRNHTLHVLSDDKEYLYLLNRYNIYPFGHLLDSLQMTYKMEKVGLDKSTMIALKNRSTSHTKNIEQHLNLFGFDYFHAVNFHTPSNIFEKDIHPGPYTIYQVPILWYSTIEAPPARWNPNRVDWIRSKYDICGSDYVKKSKLYLNRPVSNSFTRGVENNDEIVTTLKSEGFTIVTGKESLLEMIKLFYDAEVIVAPHGAMIMNMIHCRSKPYILEFCPDNRRDHGPSDNGKACGYNYNQIFLPSTGNHIMTIPVDMLTSLLKKGN